MIDQNAPKKDGLLVMVGKTVIGFMEDDQQKTDSVIDEAAERVGKFFRGLPVFRSLLAPVCQTYPEPDPVGFNEVFVAANQEIRDHGFEGVRRGTALLREAQKFGHHVPALRSMVLRFELALARYDEKYKAGTLSHEDDVYCHSLFTEAEEYMRLINDWLIAQGLGFVPVPSPEAQS